MSAHSSTGASGAKRWMNCPASIALAELLAKGVGGLPEETESEYAKEGTKAHELAEKTLTNYWSGGGDPLSAEDLKPYPLEMMEFVHVYTREVVSLIESIHMPEVRIEMAADMTYIHEDLWGTADAVVYDPDSQHLHVFDLKYGEGIMVEAHENPQLLFYAGCMLMEFMPKTITSYIIQPRATMGDVVKAWTYDVERLITFEAEVKEALAWVDTYRGLAEKKGKLTADCVNPGDWCQFCPAVTGCPKHLENFTALEEVSANTDVDLLLTDEQIHHYLSMEKGVTKWLSELKKNVQNRLLSGEKVEGFKLVMTSPHRAWKNEGTVIRKFGKRTLTKEVILSPAQAEKVIPAKDLERYITKPEGSPVMALAEDKRKAVDPPALEMFGEM